MVAKRLVVRLSHEEKRMLRELAEIENASMTEVVRRIIDQAYEEHRKVGTLRAAEDAPVWVQTPTRRHTTTDRLEMHLDIPDRMKLEALAVKDPSLSDAVRRLMEEAYEVVMRARRQETVERIAHAQVGPPPDLDELKLLVDEAASPARLH